MSTLAPILLLIPAIVCFNFLYWKSLQEDYTDNKIFTSAGAILLSLFTGTLLGKLFSSTLSSTSIFTPTGLWFWGAMLGFSLSLLAINKIYRFKINELFEASVYGLLSFLLILSLATSLLYVILMIFICSVHIVLKLNYKKIRIYKSGKIGLSAAVSLGLFFAIRAIIAIFINPFMLSFVGKIDGIISACLVFGLFLWAYNLSELK